MALSALKLSAVTLYVLLYAANFYKVFQHCAGLRETSEPELVLRLLGLVLSPIGAVMGVV